MRLVRKKFTSRKYDFMQGGGGGKIAPCHRSEVPARQNIFIFEIRGTSGKYIYKKSPINNGISQMLTRQHSIMEVTMFCKAKKQVSKVF